MNRKTMLSDIECHYLERQALEPEEKMDIPAAMQYFEAMDDAELAEEYSYIFRC